MQRRHVDHVEYVSNLIHKIETITVDQVFFDYGEATGDMTCDVCERLDDDMTLIRFNDNAWFGFGIECLNTKHLDVATLKSLRQVMTRVVERKTNRVFVQEGEMLNVLRSFHEIVDVDEMLEWDMMREHDDIREFLTAHSTPCILKPAKM